MPFEIRALGFDKEDTGEVIGMALDAQFENLVNSIIPEETKSKLPALIRDLLPAITAWAIRRYAGTTGTVDAMLEGIMKKNIAEVVSARWLAQLKIG